MKIPRLLTPWKAPLPRLEVWFGGVLVQYGWYRTRSLGVAVDREGKPLPWFTYAAIDFISGRVQPSWTVFEYGSGNGTLWWAARVRDVHAVESHAGWHEAMVRRAPANARVQLETGGATAYAAAVHRPGLRFDVIVVDGEHRPDCAREAVAALAPGGVLIWDDAQREEYAPGMAALAAAGFRRIDFTGLAPVTKHASQTAFFYRADNVLGL